MSENRKSKQDDSNDFGKDYGAGRREKTDDSFHCMFRNRKGSTYLRASTPSCGYDPETARTTTSTENTDSPYDVNMTYTMCQT